MGPFPQTSSSACVFRTKTGFQLLTNALWSIQPRSESFLFIKVDTHPLSCASKIPFWTALGSHCPSCFHPHFGPFISVGSYRSCPMCGVSPAYSSYPCSSPPAWHPVDLQVQLRESAPPQLTTGTHAGSLQGSRGPAGSS